MKGEKTLALFKIFKGKKINLPKTYTEGYCYFTEDDGKFYIDTTSNASGRKCLNASHADSADTAAKAESANSATNATNAGHAESADSATKANEATVSSGLKTGAILDSQEKIDNFLTGNVLKYNLFKTTDTNNIDMQSNDGMLISIPWSNSSYGSQLAIDDTISPKIKIRGRGSNSWGDWSTFLLSSNYTDYTVGKDGTGATGTWGINITGKATMAGSADAVTWNNVSGKPDNFTPSAHTHSNYASSVTTTGSGNAITAISQSGNTITATKGNTFALSNHTHSYAPIVDGLIPSTYLPSYVDDVIEGYYNGTGFYKNKSGTTYSNQINGETGKIYTDLSTEKIYRWSGSKFVVISETLALGETSSTAYAGDKGKIAYNHSQSLHAPTNAEENQYTWNKIKIKASTSTTAGDINADEINFQASNKEDTLEIMSEGTMNIQYSGGVLKFIGTGATADHTHSNYVNQNAFSNIKINSGTTPIAATSATDTFNLIAGNNVTITNNGKNITIAATNTNTTYGLSSSKSANNTNTYLTLTPNSGSPNSIQIKGTGATSISTDSNGVISINSPTVPNIPSLSKGTNITATKTLAHTGTFTAITGFAVSGHTITPEVTTFTMPSDNNTTYSEGTGISISGTTISNSGVRSIDSGTANGTISVNTGGTTVNVKVKGLGSAAYTDSSAYQSAITGAASTITDDNLVESHALISNASGKVAISGTTSQELQYLQGVTSAIQTQLNGTVKTTGNQTINGIKTFKDKVSLYTSSYLEIQTQNNLFALWKPTGADEVSLLAGVDQTNLMSCNLSLGKITLNDIQALNTEDAELIAAYNALA